MSQAPLPLLGGPPPERRDAARNREALLDATTRLLDHCGVDAVTMDAVAAAAGVGKGTVFRRFGSRAGLMAAMLNFRELAFQTSVLSGPPPLGPGAPPMERLLAFGRSRLEYNLTAGQLIEAAGRAGRQATGVRSFGVMHVTYLLGQLGVEGDRSFLATAVLAPLDSLVLEDPERLEELVVDDVVAGWTDLVHRVVTGHPSRPV